MPFKPELKRPDLKGQFPCPVLECPKVFCHSSSLSRHRMQAHLKSYICTQCSPNCEIETTETLRTHMTKCHSISRMFMCKCCNWAFPDKTSLHIHARSIANSNGTDPGDVIVLARSSIEGGPAPLDPTIHPGMHFGNNGDFDDSSQDDIGQDSPLSSLSSLSYYGEAGDESDNVAGSQAPTQVNTLPHHGHMFATALATLAQAALAATENTLGGANDRAPAAQSTAQTPPQKKRAKLLAPSASIRSDGATHDSSLSVSVSEARRTGASSILGEMSSPVLVQDTLPRVGSDAQHQGRKLHSLIDNLLARRKTERMQDVNLSEGEQALKDEADRRRNRRKARIPQRLAPQFSSSQFEDESTKLKKAKGLDRDIKREADETTAEDILPGCHSPEQPSSAVSSHSQTSGSSVDMEAAIDGVQKYEKCYNCEELKSQLSASKAQLELSEREIGALRSTAEWLAKFGLSADLTNLAAE